MSQKQEKPEQWVELTKEEREQDLEFWLDLDIGEDISTWLKWQGMTLEQAEKCKNTLITDEYINKYRSALIQAGGMRKEKGETAGSGELRRRLLIICANPHRKTQWEIRWEKTIEDIEEKYLPK